jgi:hypothetical protein
VSEKAKKGIVAHGCERERVLVKEYARGSEGRDFRRTALVGRGQLVGEGFGEGQIGQIGTTDVRGSSGSLDELVGVTCAAAGVGVCNSILSLCVKHVRASGRYRISQY